MEDNKLVVVARIKARDGHEERVKFALKALIGPTRKEEGCISYYWHQSLNDKTLFMSHEVWTNQEVFFKHLETPYIKAMQESGEDILEGSLEVSMFEVIS
jgi:quinol monooxygenase YgiN